MSVSNICRMCLTQSNDDKLKSMLLPVSNDSISLWSMYDFIMNLANYVVINHNLGSIPHICIKCEEDLKTAYAFKLMCSETEETLNNVGLVQMEQSCENESKIEAKIEAKIELSDNESEIECIYFDDECIEYDLEGDAEDNVHDYEKTDFTDDIDVCNDQSTVNHNINEIATKQEWNSKEVKPTDLVKRKCRKCKIKFENMQEYRAHYREHHQRMYQRKRNNDPVNGRNCVPCNIHFKTLKEYSFHYRQLHARKRPSDRDPLSKVICPHCGKLIGKKRIGRHIEEKHSTENLRHECKVCSKSFGVKLQLYMHMRIHNNDKRWKCEFCGELFLHWATRKSHIRSKHTFEKDYECHLCGQKFSHNSNLHRHIRRHNNDLAHSCTVCPKAFITKRELDDHQIVHTKDKNEICEICHKSFGTQKNLKAHMRIHSGDRNYVCWVCDKRFTQAHVLRTHLKTHAGVEMPERGAILSQKALKTIKKN